MVRKIAGFINSIVMKAGTLFVVLAGIQLVLMVFTATYGVIMRYFFRSPEPISYELGTIFLVWTYVFAMPEVEKDGEHITSDIFTQLMPVKVRRFLKKLISPILGIVFCSVLTWKGWTGAMYSLKIKEISVSVWAEPIYPVKIMIPVCYGLVVLVLLSKFYKNIMSYVTGEHEEEDPDEIKISLV
ncbi:MAG: TRAP transporter small permease [Spirochaetes bacterium]|nr:TRAP transporter small permease [Spirochaetota bacterium]